MKIQCKTRGIAKSLRHIKAGEPYFLGVVLEDKHTPVLEALKLSVPPIPGERILPGNFGPACRRNAYGHEIIHDDQPKETAFRQAEWRWKEFRGRYDFEEKSKIVDVPYLRYPRTAIAPYATELEIKQSTDGELLVVAGPFRNEEDGHELGTNAANVFVELFGGCLVLNDKLRMWNKTPLRQLNWELLPPGQNPWESAQKGLQKLIERSPLGNQPVIQARFSAVGTHEPEYVAIGQGGFTDYVVFGFPSKGFCILESNATNNATYVLNDSSWEAVSRLSKAEILNSKAHKARLIHRSNWFKSLNELIHQKPEKNKGVQ